MNFFCFSHLISNNASISHIVIIIVLEHFATCIQQQELQAAFQTSLREREREMVKDLLICHFSLQFIHQKRCIYALQEASVFVAKLAETIQLGHHSIAQFSVQLTFLLSFSHTHVHIKNKAANKIHPLSFQYP